MSDRFVIELTEQDRAEVEEELQRFDPLADPATRAQVVTALPEIRRREVARLVERLRRLARLEMLNERLYEKAGAVAAWADTWGGEEASDTWDVVGATLGLDERARIVSSNGVGSASRRRPMAHPNEELARSEMEAALRGDFEGMLEHYTDDAVLHYPGRNPLSGTHRGKDGFREWGRRFEELLGPGGSLTRTLHDVLANDDHAIQLVSVEARRTDGRSARWNAALVMHVRDGKFSEVWFHLDDPYAVDELFA